MFDEDILSEFRTNNYFLMDKYLEILKNLNQFTKEFMENYINYKTIINENKIITIKQINKLEMILNKLFELSLVLKKVYNENIKFFNIFDFLFNSSQRFVEKIRYISSVRGNKAFAHSVVTGKSFFYSLNQDVLYAILSNLKSISSKKSTGSIITNDNDLSIMFKQIINDVRKISQNYIPDVIFKKIPESVERFLDDIDNFKSKFQLISYMIKKDFYIDMISVSKDGLKRLKENIIDKQIDVIKIKGIHKDKGVSKLLELDKSNFDDIIFNKIL